MNDIWNKYEKIIKISSSPYGSIIKAKEKKQENMLQLKN